MWRASSFDLLPFDLEIERTLRRVRKEKRNTTLVMAAEENNRNNQQQVLRDYFKHVLNDNYLRIWRLTVNTNNFEFKPLLINMVQQNQYQGLVHEGPNIDLAMFQEICDTVKINGVSEDAIRLRLFRFSLRQKARGWLQSLQPRSITNWEELAQWFLLKFFPPSKTSQLRSEIAQFRQLDFEPVYKSWDRFKDLIWRCPQRGYQDWFQIQFSTMG